MWYYGIPVNVAFNCIRDGWGNRVDFFCFDISSDWVTINQFFGIAFGDEKLELF